MIDRVVEADRCSGCGVCAGVCPQNALQMGVNQVGDPVPKRVQECEACGLCLQVCPFAEGVHSPRALNQTCFAHRDDTFFHRHVGYYHRCIAGFSPVHRATSASGGLLTYCLQELLAESRIDKAAVVGPTQRPEELFRFVEVSDEKQLPGFSGSVYYPVHLADIVRAMSRSPDERWAVVGVPCLCAALRSAAMKVPRLGNSLHYLFGLACGMYQNSMYTELLCHESGVRPSEVVQVDYRVKSKLGPANNYGFQASGSQGNGKVIWYRGLPRFLGKHGYFRLNACNYCMDVFAEAADACFMDAWLPEYSSERRGTSLVILRRNDLATQLLSEGVDTQQVPIGRAVESQEGPVRRKRILIDLRRGGKPRGASFYERGRWWLVRRTQKRSKTAWSRVRSGAPIWRFWVSLADLLLIQKSWAFAAVVRQWLRTRIAALRG